MDFRHADEHGALRFLHRTEEGVQRCDRNAGHCHRQRDLEERADWACAHITRSFFLLPVHRAERARRQPDHKHHRIDHVDDYNAGVGTHQIISVKQHGDRSVDPKLWKCVGQQKRQHEQLAPPIFKAGDGVRSRNAQGHRNKRGDDRNDKRLCNGRNQIVLAEYIPPPLEAPRLWQHRRHAVFIRKRQHQHIQHWPIEKQDECGKQDKLQKFSFPNCMIEPLWIEHFEHICSHSFCYFA